MAIDLDALEAVLAKATQGEWSVWRERVADRAAAIAELAEQVNATEPMTDALILLNAGGKCPATTGCGPNSDNNAAAIVALHNAAPALIAEHRALLARVEVLEGEVTRLRDLADWIGHDRRLSLAHYSPFYGDDDDQSEEWRVEKQSGPINDREWTVVGRGQTPSEAISAARAALEPKP